MTQDEVLRAEQMVRDLAAEMARAKGLADGVDAIRERLTEAERALGMARDSLAEATGQLQKASDTVRSIAGTAEARLGDATAAIEQLRSGIVEFVEEMQRGLESLALSQQRLNGLLETLGNQLRDQMELLRGGLGTVTEAIEAVADLVTASRADTERLSALFTEKTEALARADEEAMRRLDTVHRLLAKRTLWIAALGMSNTLLLMVLLLLAFLLQ